MAAASDEKRSSALTNIVVFGPAAVGKSASVVQYINSVFVETYDPTLENNFVCGRNIDGSTRMLQIVDTAGTDEFAGQRVAYMRSSAGFLFIYDITSRHSFELLDEILQQLEFAWPAGPKRDASVFVTIAGNKLDLAVADAARRQVSTEEGQAKAAALKAKGFKSVNFFEYSAKTRENLDEMFDDVVRRALAAGKTVPNSKRNHCALL